MENNEVYLKAILATVARQTFSTSDLMAIVAPNKTSKKNFDAFNLCDGSLTQGDVVKKLKLNKGNFSTTLARWIELGVIIKLVDGKDVRPIHVYPIPSNEFAKAYRK